MPRGTNGIAHCEIEIDTVPIMRNKINCVGHMTFAFSGIERHGAWQTIQAGSKIHYLPTGHYRDIFGSLFDYGVTITAFQAHDAYFNGVGSLTPSMQMAYALSWQKAGQGEYVQRVGGLTRVGFAGAEGHFYIEGPYQGHSTAHGVAVFALNRMNGIFSLPGPIHGIAVAILRSVGGPLLIEYGELLTNHYTIQPTPAYGQLWPRRITLPVGPH